MEVFGRGLMRLRNDPKKSPLVRGTLNVDNSRVGYGRIP
jgi:hypothetical protein